jgi:ribokinase
LGTVVVDHVSVLERFPDCDTKNEVLESHMQVGGPVPTALVLLSRFGCRTRFVGCWSDDEFGQFIEADLLREGVDVSGSLRGGDCTTGFAQVWLDQATGRRTIACTRPQGMDDATLDASSADCDVLHLDGWPAGAARRAAEAVKAAGGRVSLDTGSAKPEMARLIELVDILNCPRGFLRDFVGTDDLAEGARRLADLGPQRVSVTDGARGAVLWQAGQLYRQSAMPVRAVDTCGAGDVFCGAALYGHLSGWEPQRILQFAVRTAGLKCTGFGNRAALPLLEDVLAALETR